MKINHIIKIAFNNLRTNKSRSVLTILGIIIGITAIIFIMSIGNGAKDLIAGEITSLGADIIWIEPGREPQGPTDFAGTMLSNTLKDKDIEALQKKENVPDLAGLAPAIAVTGSVSYGSETYRPFISGWSADFFAETFKIYPQSGFYFDEAAIRNQERVAVIGAKVKKELFGEEEAVGKYIKINQERFRITGVLPEKGQIFFFDVGDFVIIPYTTAKAYLLGIDYYNEVWARVKDVDSVPAAIKDIERTLREQHNITNPEKDDFYILTQQNMLDQVDGILNILTAAVAAIAAISLIVGGVGVMNIMLVSVTERIREIGLRKALGATDRDIILQFLAEAVILTILGGIIGVALGTFMSYASVLIFTKITGISWTFSFPFSALFLGFLVSGGVGLVFGIYPARQASLKNPIDALRYE